MLYVLCFMNKISTRRKSPEWIVLILIPEYVQGEMRLGLSQLSFESTMHFNFWQGITFKNPMSISFLL